MLAVPLSQWIDVSDEVAKFSIGLHQRINLNARRQAFLRKVVWNARWVLGKAVSSNPVFSIEFLKELGELWVYRALVALVVAVQLIEEGGV